MHSPELHQKFIELRAAANSIPKISPLLDVAQSTLRLWEKDDALEIARLRRIYWEDAEDKVGITLEDRLRRMAEWVKTAEDELEKRQFDIMSNRDLMRFLRESRREYFRLRAMLFSAEHTIERTHRARSIPKGLRPKAQGCEERATLGKNSHTDQPQRGCGLPHQSIDSEPPSTETRINPEAPSVDAANDTLTLPSVPDAPPINTPIHPAGPANLSHPVTASAVSLTPPEPTAEKIDKIGELADFQPTQPRNTNDLQNPKSSSADFSSLVIPTSLPATPVSPAPDFDIESIVVSPYECLQSVLQKYLEAEAVHANNSRYLPGGTSIRDSVLEFGSPVPLSNGALRETSFPGN